MKEEDPIGAAMMKRSAEEYRLAQAQKLLDMFEAANGHPARTMQELVTWQTGGR
jgi:hypothetical protein